MLPVPLVDAFGQKADGKEAREHLLARLLVEPPEMRRLADADSEAWRLLELLADSLNELEQLPFHVGLSQPARDDALSTGGARDQNSKIHLPRNVRPTLLSNWPKFRLARLPW